MPSREKAIGPDGRGTTYQVVAGALASRGCTPLHDDTATAKNQGMRELVSSLTSGVHDFELLAIDDTGNQTITEGMFVQPK